MGRRRLVGVMVRKKVVLGRKVARGVNWRGELVKIQEGNSLPKNPACAGPGGNGR